MSLYQLALYCVGGISALALLHTYVFYPLSLVVITLFQKQRETQRPFDPLSALPTVTIICAAHNEEFVVQKKVENFFELEYPADKLLLLIGSDGSTDGTNAILQSYEHHPRVWVRYFDRSGKPATINRLVREVSGDLIVFTDANTLFAPDAILKFVRHFSDPQIGGVCGNLQLIPSSCSIGALGEEAYWEFETWLKKMEGKIYSTLGATGAVYAIRRELFFEQPTDGQYADDFLLPLRITAKGFKIIFDRELAAFEETTSSMTREFSRKIRVAVGTFNTISLVRDIASHFPPFVRYALFSHKYLRWTVPFTLLGVFASSLLLFLSTGSLGLLLFIEGCFLFFVALGWIGELFRLRLGKISLPFYYCTINLALLIGWCKFFFTKPASTWISPERTTSTRN